MDTPDTQAPHRGRGRARTGRHRSDRELRLDGCDQSWFCNGALIAPNKVLTAAQCVKGRTLTNRDRAVILGGTTYKGDLDGTLPYAPVGIATASDGALYAPGVRARRLTTRSSAGTGWGGYNKVVQSDLNCDGVLDYVVRATSGTASWRQKVSGRWVNTRIATGRQILRQILAPGDISGDTLPDLLTVDSGGTLRRHPGNGKGNGTFAAATKGAAGLNSFTVFG